MIQSAEEFACTLNAAHNQRIVDGIGQESRECGVYDPQYDSTLIRSRDKEIVGECEKVAKEVLLDYGMDSGTLMVKDLVLALAQVLREISGCRITEGMK
jgi:hypothetical protein